MTAIPHRRDRVHIPADPVRVRPRNSLSQLSFLLGTPRPERSHLTILPRAVLGRPYARGPHPGTRVTVNANTPIRSCRHRHRRCRNHHYHPLPPPPLSPQPSLVTVLYRPVCCCCCCCCSLKGRKTIKVTELCSSKIAITSKRPYRSLRGTVTN